MFRYLLVPHSFVATYLNLAHTSISADSPSGKTPQVERCENMLACFHIRAEDVSANNQQLSSFCVFPGSGVQGCCSSLCCASACVGSPDKSASLLLPYGKARLRISVPYHAVSVQHRLPFSALPFRIREHLRGRYKEAQVLPFRPCSLRHTRKFRQHS